MKGIFQHLNEIILDELRQRLSSEEIEIVNENLQKALKSLEYDIQGVSGLEIEILAAPSIRHCGNPNEPQPLAEDIVGLISVPPNYLISYVADGAPGPKIGDFFSSRIHARVLGNEVFREWAIKKLKEGRMPRLGDEKHFKHEIIQIMKQKLQESLGQDFRKKLENRIDELPKFSNYPGLQWQVSFTGIILDVYSRILYLFNIGDTAVCVGVETGIEVEEGQPFYTTILLREQTIDFKFVFSPIIKIFKNVQGVAIMSDGVYGRYSNLTRVCNMNFEELVKFLRKMSIPTGDDKSLLIISLPTS